MARVFVSHASEDLDTAGRIAGWLRDAGHDVFLDHDLEHGLGVGDAWVRRLFDELYEADALVAVVSAAFGRSPWCAAEVGVALANGVRVLPVRAEPGASYRMVSSEIHWAVLDGDGAGARDALVRALRRLDGAGGSAWSRGMPVYPGLAAFETGQARVFFGRHGESRRLAERLRAPVGPGGGGLLAVVGPSGCGKSSLVRAGLVPLLAGDPDWLVLSPLVPAAAPVADPVAVLVRLLAGEGRRRGLDWTTGQVSGIVGRPGGLTRLVADLLATAASAGRVLLVVDQAEELLTRTPQAARRGFAGLLLEATGGPVRVVATVRSEFLDPLARLAGDTGLPVESLVLAPLARDMLPLVITGPARHAGIGVEDELVARMVADTGSGDALPLLAFVLEQLAQGVDRGGRLSAERYEGLGGVQGALIRRADIALTEAAAASGRGNAEVLAGLLRLVTIDEHGRVTRRRSDLAALPAEVRTEMQVFVGHRLLTTRGSSDGESGPPVIELAHEQILTTWTPLADTITAQAESLRLRSATLGAADDWQRRGRPTSHLWELSRATTTQRTLDPDELTPTARDFLTASHRHGQTRRTRAVAILSILLLLVTTGGITALVQWRTAVQRQNDIETAQLRAIADGLLVRADAARDSDPRAALRYGLAANTITPDDQAVFDRVTSNLLETLTNTPYLTHSLTDHTDPVSSVAFTGDGHTLATGSYDQTVILWDVADPAHPRRLGEPLTGHTDAVVSVAFTDDGHTLATGSSDRTVILWDVADPAHPRRLGDPLTGHTDAVVSVAFTDDGHTLATGSYDQTVILWDVSVLNRLRDDAVSLACQRAGRGLTSAEWTTYIPDLPYQPTC